MGEAIVASGVYNHVPTSSAGGTCLFASGQNVGLVSRRYRVQISTGSLRIFRFTWNGLGLVTVAWPSNDCKEQTHSYYYTFSIPNSPILSVWIIGSNFKYNVEEERHGA